MRHYSTRRPVPSRLRTRSGRFLPLKAPWLTGVRRRRSDETYGFCGVLVLPPHVVHVGLGDGVYDAYDLGWPTVSILSGVLRQWVVHNLVFLMAQRRHFERVRV